MAAKLSVSSPAHAGDGTEQAVRQIESRPIRTVVLAKARTHYPRYQLVRDAGATIPSIIKCGGYGSWPSPGRQTTSPQFAPRLMSPAFAGTTAGKKRAAFARSASTASHRNTPDDAQRPSIG